MKTIEERARDCVAAIRSWERYLEEQHRSRTEAEIDRERAEYIAEAIKRAVTAERRRAKRETRDLPRGAS